MTFEASTINDIDSIFQFYDMAVEYQKPSSINIGKVLKEIW